MAITKTDEQKILPGAWDKLSTEVLEKKPRVTFDVNITQRVTFTESEPKEMTGDTGAYYIFEVVQKGEAKIIMTSAWTLLRHLKALSPLKGKTLDITKRLVKGKQEFEVTLVL